MELLLALKGEAWSSLADHPLQSKAGSSSRERGYYSRALAGTGLPCSTPGSGLNGPCLVGSIDFMFICEGTESEITK